jgi:hypothetical protein
MHKLDLSYVKGNCHVKWCNRRCEPEAVSGHPAQYVHRASQSTIEKKETSKYKKQRSTSETNQISYVSC